MESVDESWGERVEDVPGRAPAGEEYEWRAGAPSTPVDYLEPHMRRDGDHPRALTHLSLSARQSVVTQYVWTGATGFAGAPLLRPLPTGTYYFTASLSAFQGAIQTAPLALTVQGN